MCALCFAESRAAAALGSGAAAPQVQERRRAERAPATFRGCPAARFHAADPASSLTG